MQRVCLCRNATLAFLCIALHLMERKNYDVMWWSDISNYCISYFVVQWHFCQLHFTLKYTVESLSTALMPGVSYFVENSSIHIKCIAGHFTFCCRQWHCILVHSGILINCIDARHFILLYYAVAFLSVAFHIVPVHCSGIDAKHHTWYLSFFSTHTIFGTIFLHTKARKSRQKILNKTA